MVETWEDNLGMCSTDLNTTLQMCGLKDGGKSLLRMWFIAIAEMGMMDNTRNSVIKKQLNEVIFDNAEIPVAAPLLQMIRERKWLANYP